MRPPANRPIVVGLGEILWDLLPHGRQLGGAPANFAYHAHALGAESAVVSAVGDDEPGREILRRLDALALNREFVAVDPRHPTGAVSVQLDGQGVPAYRIHENVAWDFIPFPPGLEKLAATADVIGFGSLAQRAPVSRGTIRRFLAAAQPRCRRIFDLNLRQSFYDRAGIESSLRGSNVLKLNTEELPVLAGMFGLRGTTAAQLRQLLDRFSLELIALTRGPQGAILQTPQQQASCTGFSVQIADTVGAGDAFTAALAIGLWTGASLDAINQHACRLAAFVCSQPGATPALPPELVSQTSKK
jgi:fructokinase